MWRRPAPPRPPDSRFSQGDMTALPQKDGTFGAMVCFYALIHIPRWRVPEALAEMRRTLAPGAPLLLAVHGGTGSLHADEMLERPVSLDATLFALDELTAAVEAAGFDVVEAHERAPYEEELATPPSLCVGALSVFHRPPHHESEDVAARIDHLMAAVFMADDTTRLAQLAAHVAPAFVYARRPPADVGCIVLTGADPAFCAGMDLKSLATELRDRCRRSGNEDRPGKALGHDAAPRPDAGHRRHQRRRRDRRPRAGPVLRLPHRLGTGTLRRHARPGRRHARRRHDHPAAPAHRPRPGPPHELDRRLHRRGDGAGLGPGGRGGPPRVAAGAGRGRSPPPSPSIPAETITRGPAHVRGDRCAERPRGLRGRGQVVPGVDGGALRPVAAGHRAREAIVARGRAHRPRGSTALRPREGLRRAWTPA
jgi:hypothetical protein